MSATCSKSPQILNYSKDSRKTNLNELWSVRLIQILIPNPPKLYFGQEVIHCHLQGLDYNMGDRYTLTPKTKEDIEFQRGIVVKLKPEKFEVWKLS
jgi:hypothetical protein